MKNLADIKYIKQILSKHGFNFSKSLGQNFLINPTICPKMAEYCINNDDNANILEIGPGIGVLTYELAKRAEKVVSIELDKKLMPILEETLEEFNNVKIINDDILKIDLKNLINTEFGNNKVSVCANLPYYITSPVIMKLLEENLPITSITVMVQKEAAERICAIPGSRESGAISIGVRYYAEPQILFKVSRGNFMPSPNVDSAVIKLNILNNPPFNVNNRELFFKIVKASFSQRRKTIVNSLSSGLNITKADIENILVKNNISPLSRPEQLSFKNFTDISNSLY